MKAPEFDPAGSTVVWEIVSEDEEPKHGGRVDRIHVLDTAHIQTRLALRMIVEDPKHGGEFAGGHPHDIYHHLSREQAVEIRDGHRFAVVGHTVWLEPDGEVAQGMIWVPSHVYAGDGCRFRTARTMVDARVIVAQHDLVSRTVDRALARSLQRRFTWNARERKKGQASG